MRLNGQMQIALKVLLKNNFDQLILYLYLTTLICRILQYQMKKPTMSVARSRRQESMSMNRAKEEHDFLIFLCYLRRSPKIVQEVFNPYVKELANQYTSSSTIGHLIQKLKTNTKGKIMKDGEYSLLQENFASLLNLDGIANKMRTIKNKLPQIQGKIENTTSYNDSAHPINLVRPKYYLTEKIAKQEAQIDLGIRTQNLSNNESHLYTEPRFYERLNELVHFKNNKKHKGSILLLEYQGHALYGGRTYAVLNNSSVEIWQMSSHIFPFPFAAQENQNESLQYSSDLNGSIKPGHIDEPVFSKKYKFIAHKDKVTCASFSSDEFYLITGGVDRKVKLWCLRLRILLAEYKCHTKTIWDVCFNPSGYYFLSGSADGLMVLWKTDTSFAQRIFNHGSDVYKVSFAKNPNYAISAGEDCKIKVWHILEAQIKYSLQLANPAVNINIGHSGIFIVAIESDGRVTIFNLIQGSMIISFYFYSKRIRQTCQSREIIHDACLSEDERELTCITSQHILHYSMDVLESQRKINVFEKSSKSLDPERKVTPKEVLMIPNKMRLNFCGYRDYRLLVVGAATQ